MQSRTQGTSGCMMQVGQRTAGQQLKQPSRACSAALHMEKVRYALQD